jgi:rubrerythrin
MTPLEILKIALARERSSVEMYRRIINEHGSIRELGEQLLVEEEKHIKMIQKKIDELSVI